MVNLHEIKVIDYLELNIVAENAIEVSRDRKSLCEKSIRQRRFEWRYTNVLIAVC
jgi:hypothetical protein